MNDKPNVIDLAKHRQATIGELEAQSQKLDAILQALEALAKPPGKSSATELLTAELAKLRANLSAIERPIASLSEQLSNPPRVEIANLSDLTETLENLSKAAVSLGGRLSSVDLARLPELSAVAAETAMAMASAGQLTRELTGELENTRNELLAARKLLTRACMAAFFSALLSVFAIYQTWGARDAATQALDTTSRWIAAVQPTLDGINARLASPPPPPAKR